MREKAEGQPAKKEYRAAIYVRLSREDDAVAFQTARESNSIVNQKALILEFLKTKPDIRVCAQRVDDGFSGATFERPAFQKMMEDIKKGRIDCVVVKDLSRFGRNYIEAGRYIEEIFPFLGVRFISVNDQYDSLNSRNRSDDLLIPFKNLINDAYCRDISTKIRSQFDVKRRKGDFIGSFAAYGYLKSKEDHNRLVVDDYAAAIVRDIFRWKLSGMSQQRIANYLNRSGVLSPMEYKNAMGLAFECGLKHGSQAKWSPSAVTRILTSQVYLGTMEQGKRLKPDFRRKQRLDIPSQEWVRVAGTHEAIVSQADFDAVTRMMKRDTRVAPGETAVYPFSGLLLCGDCGHGMIRKTAAAGGQRYTYYVCALNKREGVCSSHRIRQDLLEAAVSALFGALTDLFENGADFCAFTPSRGKDESGALHLAEKEREAAKYEGLLASIYEDFQDGVLDKTDYDVLWQAYMERYSAATTVCENLRKEPVPQRSGGGPGGLVGNGALGGVGCLDDLRRGPHLDRSLLVALIYQMTVFEGGCIEIFLPNLSWL